MIAESLTGKLSFTQLSSLKQDEISGLLLLLLLLLFVGVQLNYYCYYYDC